MKERGSSCSFSLFDNNVDGCIDASKWQRITKTQACKRTRRPLTQRKPESGAGGCWLVGTKWHCMAWPKAQESKRILNFSREKGGSHSRQVHCVDVCAIV